MSQQFRNVIRTTKGGRIKQHIDIDWIFYASVSVSNVWFSTTTRTLEEAEEWIAKTITENKQPRKPYPKQRFRENYLEAEEYYLNRRYLS